MTDPLIKTLIIKKRGRKYFEAVIGGYKAKLVINSVSANLEIDRVVKMQVTDLSKRSRYGTELIFEPVAILDDRDAEALREVAQARKEAEKWLGYAEQDVKNGYGKTNAISQALSLCGGHEHLSERLAALRDRVERNAAAYEAQRQAQQQQWAKERAAEEARRAERRQHRVLFPLAARPQMDVALRLHGQVVVFESTGKAFRISEDDPSVGGSHLLGHEGSMGCYCYYRPATEQEIADLEAREAAARVDADAIRQRQDEIRAIKAQIVEQGECPEGDHVVDGERLLNTQDVHGGGDWFVVTEDHVWYVRNNAMDGDDWSRNNVLTGGAGAIGYRVPRDDGLVDRLRALDASRG